MAPKAPSPGPERSSGGEGRHCATGVRKHTFKGKLKMQGLNDLVESKPFVLLPNGEDECHCRALSYFP